MYNLYLDKPENFTCEVQVKNASLKDSKARLIVESNEGVNFIFNGKIENGKCMIPIRRLKGLLEENSGGNISLEIIVEDTYFVPWKDTFTTEEHTSVKVKLTEQKQSTKPSVTIKPPTCQSETLKRKMIPLIELSGLFQKFDIKRSNINERKADFCQIINEYFKYNQDLSSERPAVLRLVKYILK